MQNIIFDAEAGQVSSELNRRGIAAGVRVLVSVQIIGKEEEALPMDVIAQAALLNAGPHVTQMLKKSG